MNSKRLAVLGFALVAASAAAFLARGFLGGGTPKVQAKPQPVIAMSEVLVASANLPAGRPLTAQAVHWEKWPTASVATGFITHASVPSLDDMVKGTVVRIPLLAGQPITTASIVHGDAAGFMAAMLSPGMRAVSIAVTADSSAGGFILPNDRIDLILIQKSTDDDRRVHAHTILSDVRVLAVDQTAKQDKNTNAVIAKTVTLELTPSQAELVAKAQSQGQLSLALRPLGDTVPTPVASADAQDDGPQNSAAAVSIIRYGVAHSDISGSQQAQKPQ